MVEVRSLSVSLDGAPDVLDDVNLSVAPGELVAVAGEPGAGKSALVKAIAGDIPLSGGSITSAGEIAVVYQDLALCDGLDVASNLMLGRESHMRSESRFHAAAARELKRLAIPIADTTAEVSTLSLAQRRLLALAMTLGRNPAVLVLDEPTANLGGAASAIVDRLLSEARDAGIAVILMTRDIEQMFHISDRIVVLSRGRVILDIVTASAQREDVAALLGEEAAIAHREAAALRRSRELQRQFLSRLSHELRTPLTAIRGYATSLSAPDVSWDEASQQRFLARIAAESARLGRLVDDLLDFSAIESGVMRLNPDWCDLSLVIEAAVGVLPQQWGSAVQVHTDIHVPAIWADHDRLEQVFVNLVTNAFKHNGPDTRVTVSGRQHGDEVEIVVADDGPGIAGDPFDAERRPHARTAGAGLGLSIARGIVEAHGGRIELTLNPPGQHGTTFRLILPIEAGILAGEPAHV